MPGSATCERRWTNSALDEVYDAQLWDYLVMAAHSLVNQPSEAGRGSRLSGLTSA